MRNRWTVLALAVAAVAAVSASAIWAEAEKAPPQVKDAPKDAQSQPSEKLFAAAKKVLQQNLVACRDENLRAMLGTLHPKSPAYEQTRQSMQNLFARYDLQYELLSCHYVGRDRDYVVVRATQKCTKKAGPAFHDNVLDVLHIFRKHGEDWKLWQTAILQVQYLPPKG